MKNFDYVMPRSMDEAARACAATGTMLKGGGTDLLDRVKEGVARPDALVNLLSVAGARDIREDGQNIRLGALVTMTDIAENALLRQHARAFAESSAEAATPNVRNRATLGGNLCQRPRCWYLRNDSYQCLKKGGDTCYSQQGENKYHAIFGNQVCAIVQPSNLAPALIALDATVTIVTWKDDKVTTRDMPLSQFYTPPGTDIHRENVLGPGEVVTEVSFAKPAAGTGTAFYETREKDSFDWALTSCAAVVTLAAGRVTASRVVVSSVAPVPMRMEAVEALIAGKALDDATCKAAGHKATEGATPMRDNAYKIQLLAVTVARALKLAAERAAGGSK